MPIPAEHIDTARRTPLEAVAEMHGLKLRRSGTERVGACPRCGGEDRFAINVRKQVFLCRQCGAKGDAIALEMHITGCDFREAIESLSGGAWRPSDRPRLSTLAAEGAGQRHPQADDEDVRALVSARRIISELVPVFGSPGEAYLRDTRKIDTTAIADVLARTDAIGWHPGVYFSEPGHPQHQQRLGGNVGIMTDPVTAEPTGAISRTYIHDDRKLGKAKTLGRPAGVVGLSPDDEVLEGLCLAEGLETALSAMSIGLRPMWSTGSSGLMAAFPALPGVEALTIVVDHDASGAGENAARECEARWRAAGREVTLLMSDMLGDVNDALKAAS